MNFISIRTYDNYISANLALSLLKEGSVNCHIKDEYTVTIDPLLSPALGGMKLMVEESDQEKALDILAHAEELYLATIDCPVCHHNTLRLVTQVTQFDTWGGKLRSMLVNGQEQEVKKFYHCDTCNQDFTELPPSP
jgi:hypothetical protein